MPSYWNHDIKSLEAEIEYQHQKTQENSPYTAIEVIPCSNVHDPFLIIDNIVYFIGGSIKDLGKKIVAFSKMHQDPNEIISRLK